MRADAQSPEAWCDVYLLLRQLLDQATRHAARKARAENVWRAQALIGNQHAGIAQAFGDASGEHAQPRHDRIAAPSRHHLHSERGHLERDEMVALAHVEPASA